MTIGAMPLALTPIRKSLDLLSAAPGASKAQGHIRDRHVVRPSVCDEGGLMAAIDRLAVGADGTDTLAPHVAECHGTDLSPVSIVSTARVARGLGMEDREMRV